MSSMIRTNNVDYIIKPEILNLNLPDHMKRQFQLSLRTKRLWIIILITNLVFLSLIPIGASNIGIHNSHRENYSTPADITHLEVTWASRGNLQPTPISSGDRIAGDHILVKAECQPAILTNWTYLSINATPIPAFLEKIAISNVVEIDTRLLGNNATCIINVTVGLDNGSIIMKILDNVFLGNFFVPSVKVLTPNGGEVWTDTQTIVWQAWDMNADEILTYDVLLHSDSELNSYILATGLNENYLEWNFNELYNLSTYQIEVRVTDGIYWTADRSNGFFTAGTISPTTTSTASISTTTTTTMPFYDIRVLVFLIVLIISSTFIALVAYYNAKKI